MISVLSLIAFATAAPLMGIAQEIDEQQLERDGPLRPAELPLLDLQSRNCTDTIEHVREERGLPLLQRDLADPDEPILFRALDYDIDGCDVLLTAEGPRPLPIIPDGPITPQPAQ